MRFFWSLPRLSLLDLVRCQRDDSRLASTADGRRAVVCRLVVRVFRIVPRSRFCKCGL